MIINNNMAKNLEELQNCISSVMFNNSLTETQVENFLRKFEQTRYGILYEVKRHNDAIEKDNEKIKTIDDEYKANLENGILKIYVPEVMPSYKNLKTHTYKRILFNIERVTKQFAGTFKNDIFIYVKVFDKILGWDIDNKNIKPVADALILSGVISDDNIFNMFYCAEGDFAEIPHSEIYVLDGIEMKKILKNIVQKNKPF